jgi:hypothetical protein
MLLLHALTAWDLKFQVCLGHTFTPATLSHSKKETKIALEDVTLVAGT